MFNKEFKNKKIALLGDSIMSDGRYINNASSYMVGKKDRCYLFNRGIGGNRADMIDCLMEDEVFSIKPDYCVICFGVNDLGIWLYDKYKKLTSEIIAEREKRNQSHKNAIKRFVKYCKERGVKPILMSGYAVDQMLEEKPDIPTLGDNKEKAQLLGPWFYKRQTFENINVALQGYRDFLKELAKQENILFFDMHEKTYKYMLEEDGLFNDDGIHYSEKGHKYIAKAFLELLGYEDVPTEFSHGDGFEQLLTAKALDRAPAFIRFNMFNKINGEFTEEQILKECNRIIADDNEPQWLKNNCMGYTNNYDKIDENRKAYCDAVLKY